MTFIANAESVARTAMDAINPSLADRYTGVIRFLITEPGAASALKGKTPPPVGSEIYITKLALNFAGGRDPKSPNPPSTIPDEMVSVILQRYFDVPETDLEHIKREHLLSMGAENMVGHLLEHYLATVLEQQGWIWCSGSMVRAVDFIKPPVTQGSPWGMLQVKNRDNSENSSSSAIRNGTSIEKWFRTFSQKPELNWDAFPEESIRASLSEASFRQFVEGYLRELRIR